MESNEVKYGLLLKKKGRILGIEIIPNGDDRYACGEFTYQLDEWSSDTPWLVDSYEQALMAKWTSEEWYNSSYEEPVNPYHPLELDIIKVITIRVPAEGTIESELEVVNNKLKTQGYATIDIEDYKKDM